MKLIIELEMDAAEFHRGGEDDTTEPADGHMAAENLEKIAAKLRWHESLNPGDGARIRLIAGNGSAGSWEVRGD